jgi:hypothetical protein
MAEAVRRIGIQPGYALAGLGFLVLSLVVLSSVMGMHAVRKGQPPLGNSSDESTWQPSRDGRMLGC